MSRKIVHEISVALTDLGADSKLLDKVKAWPVDEIYTAAENLSAPAMLLAFIGSGGDTLTDEEVLEELQEWNRESAFLRQGPP